MPSSMQTFGDKPAKEPEASVFPYLARLLLVWFGLACIVAVGAGSLNLPDLWKLSKRGVTTTAHELVTAKGKAVGLEFHAGAKLAKLIDPGQGRQALYLSKKTMTIVYDPANPQIARAPPLDMEINLLGVGLAALIIPTAIVFRLHRLMQAGWGQRPDKSEIEPPGEQSRFLKYASTFLAWSPLCGVIISLLLYAPQWAGGSTGIAIAPTLAQIGDLTANLTCLFTFAAFMFFSMYQKPARMLSRMESYLWRPAFLLFSVIAFPLYWHYVYRRAFK